jgi:hypothetical protein
MSNFSWGKRFLSSFLQPSKRKVFLFATLRNQTILMTFQDKRMESSYHNHQILDLLLPLPLAAVAVLVQNTHKIVHHSSNMLEKFKGFKLVNIKRQ